MTISEIKQYNFGLQNTLKPLQNILMSFKGFRLKGKGATSIESIEFIPNNNIETRKFLIERFYKPNTITEHCIRSFLA